MLSVLRAFGFDEFEANLLDPAREKCGRRPTRCGSTPTDALRVALERAGLAVRRSTRAAAPSTGPRSTSRCSDAIGRKWQLSTIQLDFNMPERFDLDYIGADNEKHRPVMIHRALFGSVERFFGVLIEHYAGAFPTWLAPVQVRVLPVRDDHDIYARRLVDRLEAEGFRADMVEASEPLGGRIRKAKMEKLPYVLVVGDDDVEHSTVGVNPRGGEVERGVGLEDFVERLAADVTSHV